MLMLKQTKRYPSYCNDTIPINAMSEKGDIRFSQLSGVLGRWQASSLPSSTLSRLHDARVGAMLAIALEPL
jgi:hypothetical protein